MVILVFCHLGPSFCPHKPGHFILVKTGLFFRAAREEGKKVRKGKERKGKWKQGRE